MTDEFSEQSALGVEPREREFKLQGAVERYKASGEQRHHAASRFEAIANQDELQDEECEDQVSWLSLLSQRARIKGR